MNTVLSKDGSSIAYEKSGTGAALIIVVGAFNDRTTGMPLAQMLESYFTVYNYDRRGRGDSDNTLPYAVDREIEDLEAMIDVAGGSAYVFGYSSGGVLALKAAAKGLAIQKLALYEIPLIVGAKSNDDKSSQGHLSTSDGQAIHIDNNRAPLELDLASQLAQLIAEGRRGDAVELFQIKAVGIPEEFVIQGRQAPYRPALEKMAHTLEYEMRIIGDMSLPPELENLPTPTLLMVGSKSPAFMHHTAQSLADSFPDATYRSLADQTHDIVAEVVAPVVHSFLEPVIES